MLDVRVPLLRLLPLTDERLLLLDEPRRLVTRLLLLLLDEVTFPPLGRPELLPPAPTVPLELPPLGAVFTSLLEPLMRSA